MVTESADQHDLFSGRRFGCCCRLCRKLKHCRLLTFNQASQQHHLSIWKFQGIMMGMGVILIDLPKRLLSCD